MTETHLVLIGLLLVADGQVGGVDIQVDVVVTSNAPATLPSSRHPLELHLDVMALLPLLARRGEAENTTIHVHRPQQGCWHGCTSTLERIRIKAQESIYITLSLSVCFHPVYENIYYDQLFEKELSRACTDASLLWCLWPSLVLHILCTLLSISRSMQSRCDCSECWDRMRSSKDASAKRRIQGHRHPATSDTTMTIIKPGPPFIPLKVFSSVLTERCCCTVTANTYSWTSEVKSKCRTSLGLFWCRLTGLAFLLVTHTRSHTHLGSPLTNCATTLDTAAVLFIQQVELNEHQNAVITR